MSEVPPSTPALKTQLSADKKSALMKLEPITYQITLVYLGPDRIKRVKASAYNTVSELRNGADPDSDALALPLSVIGNVVNDDAPDDDSMKAAKMYADGGDDTNPTSDTVFRVVIVDNHGTRTAENLTLLGSAGDNYSNVQYYKDRGWDCDVNPAVPFRAIIKKFIGTTQVDYDTTHQLLVETKDPVEEFVTDDTPQRRFLKEFYKKYNRVTDTDTVGDDNGAKIFGGLRDHPGTAPGAKSSDIFKTVAYKAPPVIDQPGTGSNPLGTGSIDYTSLGAATVAGPMQVKLPITAEQAPGFKVGVTDFVMLPGPVGGDNYRMLLTLVDSGGADVRKSKESSVSVFVQDDTGTVIPAPRAYTTGRFIVWRRTDFTLCVLVNGTAEADMDWDYITGVYNNAFMQLTPPKSGSAPAGGYFTLTTAQWFSIVSAVMPEVHAAQDRANFTDPEYATALFPSAVVAEFTPALTAAGNSASQIAGIYKGRLIQIAQQAVALACSQASPVIPSPFSGDAQTKQDDGHGPYMFLCRDGIDDVPPSNVGSVLGSYNGDRLFWFRNPGGADGNTWASSTCAHEMGHLRSLRHSHTGTEDVTYAGGGTNTPITLVAPLSNDNPQDHDPLDAFHCLMGYTRKLDSDLCAMCQLSLRLYDRVAIQKTGNYREVILKKDGPVTVTRLSVDGAHNVTITEVTAAIPLAVASHQSADILVVGPEIAYTDRSGNNLKGRVNMTDVPTDEATKWTTTGHAASVTIAEINSNTGYARYRVTAVAAGNVTVQFRTGKDPAASCVFQVA